MKVLIVGSGGREHALAWKIRQSQYVSWLGVAPGNGGTSTVAENVTLPSDDVEAIARYARDNEIGLTIVGPEAPLAAGIVDAFGDGPNTVFGPSQAAARIESSKAYAKQLMDAAGIPTADYQTCHSLEDARRVIDSMEAPLVVKASGLAAGKGVFVCETKEDAIGAVMQIMDHRIFGDAGREIVIEEYLEGEEVSVMAITDGEDFIILPPAQDHKRIGEGDTGPNTGGMGAYCPAPVATDELIETCASGIFEPALSMTRNMGAPYKGVLYAGLMLTREGPKVLEFNCRFGDPETQAVLPQLNVDLVDLMLVSVTGKMGTMLQNLGLKPTDWKRISKSGYTSSVVLAAGGYPGHYEKGREILGLPSERDDLVVFHAGTKRDDGRLLTSGGRVLAVTGRGDTLKKSLDTAYDAADQIQFEKKYLRRDIGHRAL